MKQEIDPAYPTFVGYIDRTREYYRAQGYEKPYRYAFNTDVPFASLTKPLSQCNLGLVTTAMPIIAETGDTPRPKRVYAASTDSPPLSIYTDDLTWDRDATHMDDIESYLPIKRLQESHAAGKFGELSPRFYGIPTEYTQRHTRETDAPAVLNLLQEDQVDVALLVPI